MHNRTRSPVIVIPARYSSSRLPGKPLADIGGRPMVIRVAEAAKRASVGPVYVAVDDDRVFRVVREAGFDAVLTGASHRSGTDRVAEALNIVDPGKTFDVVVNLQGDVPTIDSAYVAFVVDTLVRHKFDIATLGCQSSHREEFETPSVVKAIASPVTENVYKALYFTRSPAPFGASAFVKHIGVYGFTREAIEKFVSLPPSSLELVEDLEQLRALEGGMTIGLRLVDRAVPSVDTQSDLFSVRSLLDS